MTTMFIHVVSRAVTLEKKIAEHNGVLGDMCAKFHQNPCIIKPRRSRKYKFVSTDR
jgi:hypothetical protein